MTNLILQSVIFFLPGFLANVTPVFAAKIPILRNWDTPIDLGYKLGNYRILGDHKTFRGIITGVSIGILSGFIQYKMSTKYTFMPSFYNDLEKTLCLSALIGFGALTGDVIKSFLKRRKGIPPGNPWLPFDWIDYLLGGLIFSSWFYHPGYKIYLALFILTPIINTCSNFLGGILKLKKKYM